MVRPAALSRPSPSGSRRQPLDGRREPLARGAIADIAHHAVPDGKARRRPAPARQCARRTRRRGKRQRRLDLILAFDNERVEEVERGVGDLDDRLARRRLSVRARRRVAATPAVQAPRRSGLSSAVSNFTHFSLTLGRFTALAAGGEAGGRNFAGFAVQRRPRAGRVQRRSRSTKEKGHMLFAARFAVRCLAAGALVLALAAGAEAETAKKAEKEKDSKDAAGKPALVGELRRLERLPQPVRQVAHLLHARPAEDARSRGPQARSRLCLHLRAAGRGRAQRGLVHHGLRGRRARRLGRQGQEASGLQGEEGQGRGQVEEGEGRRSSPRRRRSARPISSFLPKGSNLWVKNAAKESQLIDEMRKGAELKIKASSKKGGGDRGHLLADRLQPGDRPRAKGLPGNVN